MAWPQDAYVGQEIVCVDARPCPCCNTCEVKQDHNYKIKAISPPDIRGYIGIIVHGVHCMYHEWGFAHVRFRPLQSTSTGFAILRSILTNPKKEIVKETAE